MVALNPLNAAITDLVGTCANDLLGAAGRPDGSAVCVSLTGGRHPGAIVLAASLTSLSRWIKPGNFLDANRCVPSAINFS